MIRTAHGEVLGAIAWTLGGNKALGLGHSVSAEAPSRFDETYRIPVGMRVGSLFVPWVRMAVHLLVVAAVAVIVFVVWRVPS